MLIDIRQLEFIDSSLREILAWIEGETGLEFTITSLYRINDAGVHGTLPLRGTDLRCRSKIIGEKIEEKINDAWSYDIDRPDKRCAYLHGVGENLHLHIQVHKNTKRIA